MPLDIQSPAERLAYQEADAELFGVVSCAQTAGAFRSSFAYAQELFQDYPTTAPMGVELSEQNLAYIIYTSGSTGRPKGVLVEHRSVVNLVCALKKPLGLDEGTRLLMFANWAFDMSVRSWAGALGNGATLVLRDTACLSGGEAFYDFCQAHQITGMQLPTAFWQALVRQGACAFPASVEFINIGGEAVNPAVLAEWLAEDRPRLINTYGPTESTVTATLAEVSDTRNTIGQPLANVEAYVLDMQGQLVPYGVEGELYIGGVQVARGYQNRPEETNERFVVHPYRPVERLYATGDRVKRWPSGDLAYLGRSDDQVKIRGYRVELGEIEATLTGLAEVASCKVLAFESSLCAYVVGSIPVAQAQLKERLPDYMIPSQWVELEKIPLTQRGKVDTRQLRALKPEEVARQQYIAPETETERALAKIWEEVLGVEQVGMQDNFFELGGHSLLAMQLLSKTAMLKLDCEITLSDIFLYPSIEQLLSDRYTTNSSENFVLLKESKSDKNLFCMPSIYTMWQEFNEMRKLWNMDCSLYALDLSKILQDESVESYEDLAFMVAQEIQRIQPTGEYYLAGYSLGTRLAYRVGCILQNNHKNVRALISFDGRMVFDTPFHKRFTMQDLKICVELLCKKSMNYQLKPEGLPLNDLSKDARNSLIRDMLLNQEFFTLEDVETVLFYIESVFSLGLLLNRDSLKNDKILLQAQMHLIKAEYSIKTKDKECFGWSSCIGGELQVYTVGTKHHEILHEAALESVMPILESIL